MLTELIHLALAVSLATAVAPAGEKPEDKLVITDKPLTVRVEPSDAMLAGLERLFGEAVAELRTHV